MSSFLGKYSETWSNFVQLFAKGHLVYGDWFDHIAGYWELARKHPDNVLFISYEEMKVVSENEFVFLCFFLNDLVSHTIFNQLK